MRDVDLVSGLQLSDTKTNFSVLIYKQLMYKMQQIRWHLQNLHPVMPFIIHALAMVWEYVV